MTMAECGVSALMHACALENLMCMYDVQRERMKRTSTARERKKYMYIEQ